MEFKSNRGIYLQIADNLCNQILEGNLKPNDRILSVRDLAVELEVNRNTVMRSYSYLQEEGIFENKSGAKLTSLVSLEFLWVSKPTHCLCVSQRLNKLRKTLQY